MTTRATVSSPALTPALEIKQLTVEYPDGDSILKAMDRVNFSAQSGTMTAIVGPSGSGKSTLLSVSAMLTKPTKGAILLGGQEVWRLTESERAKIRRHEVGVVFQQPNLFGSLTSLEQLLVTSHVRGELKGGSKKERRATAQELLDLVGVGHLSDRRPHQLSGGQRQRVNVARALMSNPSVILADEPTAALDEASSAAIVELLAQVTNDLAVATVMVTHDTEFVSRCDAVYAMRDGVLNNELVAA